MGSEVVGRLLLRVGDARREQAIGDGLRIHICEAVGVEVVDQRLLERLHELGERANLGLDGQSVVMRSRIARASSARRTERCFDVVMTSRWRSVNAPRQRCRHTSILVTSSGQARFRVSLSATASRWSGVSRLSHPRTFNVGRSVRVPSRFLLEFDVAQSPAT